MMEPPRHTRRWSGFAVGVLGLSCALLVGCRLAPARPVCGDEAPLADRRGVALGREIVGDSAARTVARPVESAAQTAHWAAKGTHRAACDLWYKRVALPLAPHLPHCPAKHTPCCCADRMQPAQIAVDIDGARAMWHLEALLDSAQERIDILMYLWEADVLGWSLAKRLARKAESLAQAGGSGPTVRVLIDRGGNLIHAPDNQDSTAQVNAAVCWLAQQPHVEVIRSRSHLTRFDHRKLVLIDDRLAWTGGRNFTLLSFIQWHDVSFTVRGPLVEDLRRAFAAAWQDAGGIAPPFQPREQPLDDDEANIRAALVATGPHCNDLACSVYDAVDRSSNFVYLQNPYFTDSLLLWKLVRARQRGVDVRIVVAENSESCLIDHAMHPMLNRLLRAGIRVYRYPGTTHMKAALVDGNWLYLGTANFDGLSLCHNHELGLVIDDCALIGQMRRDLFETDFRAEWEVVEPCRVCPVDCAYDLLAGLFL